MIFISILVFIAILALLVLVHEFGHFIVAKKSSMQVEEFGFGFPPRLFGIKKGETTYSINALPFGGFVRILGENNDAAAAENPRSFVNKSFWQRFFTLIAGVVMNVILAWVLITIGLNIGLPTEITQGQPLPAHATVRYDGIGITQIAPNSPAEKAGLKEGDFIVSADGKKFQTLDAMVGYFKSRGGNTVSLHLQRGKQALDKQVVARANPPVGEGAMGIALSGLGRIYFPWYQTPIIGAQATWQALKLTVSGFYYLITGRVSFAQVGGPVRIAALTNQVTQLGFIYVLQLAATLSINLAVINSVPFPALDGGRILFLLIEKIRGKRNNNLIEGYVNAVGFALLLLFIIVISVRDVGFLIRH